MDDRSKCGLAIAIPAAFGAVCLIGPFGPPLWTGAWLLSFANMIPPEDVVKNAALSFMGWVLFLWPALIVFQILVGLKGRIAFSLRRLLASIGLSSVLLGLNCLTPLGGAAPSERREYGFPVLFSRLTEPETSKCDLLWYPLVIDLFYIVGSSALVLLLSREPTPPGRTGIGADNRNQRPTMKP